MAWAAGFFDGEGCVYLHRSGRGGKCHSLCLEIVQSGYDPPDTLDRAATAFPGVFLKVTGPRPQGGFGKRPMWRVRTDRFEYVQAIVAMLWPWLSQEKRGQYTRKFREWRLTHPRK